jgi:excisionase family DNA binding protein
MKFYTIPEVAEFLGVTPATVYAIHRRGDLAFVKIGRLNRITETALLQFIDKCTK